MVGLKSEFKIHIRTCLLKNIEIWEWGVFQQCTMPYKICDCIKQKINHREKGQRKNCPRHVNKPRTHPSSVPSLKPSAVLSDSDNWMSTSAIGSPQNCRPPEIAKFVGYRKLKKDDGPWRCTELKERLPTPMSPRLDCLDNGCRGM